MGDEGDQGINSQVSGSYSVRQLDGEGKFKAMFRQVIIESLWGIRVAVSR